MKQLAFITIGHSQFEDRLWHLLGETGLEPQEFESLDYFSYLPFFVLAGASVETHMESHGDHAHFQGVSLRISEDLEEPFYDALPQLLSQLTVD
jgi:hypothetical protein